MSLIFQLKTLEEADKKQAVEKLITESTPDFDFTTFVILSMAMATLGLLINSAAVIIGSMLIAPLLSPIVSMSLGITLSDPKLISRSLNAVIKSAIYGIVVAAAATIVYGLFREESFSLLTSEVLARADTADAFVYFIIAAISGFAFSYTLVRPNLSATLPGIAVAVSLIPPLAVTGIGVAALDVEIIGGSVILFVLNVLGIVLASLVVFSLMDIHAERKVAERTIKKEEKRLENEKKEEEEFKEEQQNGK